MQKSEIQLSIFLILFLLFSPISTHAISLDGEIFFDNSENKIINDSKIIGIDSDFFLENNFKRYLIFGTNLEQNSILKNNSLYGVASDHGFFSVSLLSEQTASNLITKGYTVIEDSKLDFHSSNKISPDVSRIGEITGSTNVKQKYNATGKDIVIAIVDTGVDFSNPDIQHSLARDKLNHPIMIDPDGQGIILTNSTFHANISEFDTIRNYTKILPENATSSVYLTRDGVFLDIFQDGDETTLQVYNSYSHNLVIQ